MTALTYLHPSAAAKLIVADGDSGALVEHLNGDVEVASCLLLETGLRRLARISGVAQDAVTTVLAGVTLHEQAWADHRAAGVIDTASVGDLDALHLQAAIALGADEFATYDSDVAEAARDLGLVAVSPGRPITPA